MAPLDRDALEWRGSAGQMSVTAVRYQRYELVCEAGRLGRLSMDLARLSKVLECRSVVVVTDPNPGRLFLEQVRTAARATGLPLSECLIRGAEPSKSLAGVRVVLRHLQRQNAERRTLLLALGGGVVCDLVGFVASIYMRGLPYINVPTTLMAQIDAAIGGKVGVDAAATKNLIGSFYHPASVIVDPLLLRSLPPREMRNGLAEAVKVALLRSPALFEKLEQLAASGLSDVDVENDLTPVVLLAIEIKMDLLHEDPFEISLDRVLNLGHSVAHSLEAATRFTVYRHGEAVAIGLAVAARLALLLGMCSEQTVVRVISLLENLGLDVTIPDSLCDDVWLRLAMIKRIRNGSLREVLPTAVGRCVIWTGDISRQQFRHAAGLQARGAPR